MKFNTKDHPKHFLKITTNRENEIFCNLCENRIHFESTSYCSTCQSHFHQKCLTITYPKVHHHSLFFIHRQNSFACNVCGLVGSDKINMYTCVPCDFFVHRNCIFLPAVIKITRHLHHLLHIRILYANYWRCNICQDAISHNYEGYICSDETCGYVAHTFCATRSEVWDGKDVNGESKEESNSKFDVEVGIDDRAIHDLSHDHNLVRVLIDDVGEEIDQVCQACILPIDMGSFLCCDQCDFSLHDVCARLPQKMEHMLHRHPLVLHDNIMKIKEGLFTCSICNQDSCGFMYRCCKEDCEFNIDVKCASFVEPFNHTIHQHPLYMAMQLDNRYSPEVCIACSLSSTIMAACSKPFCHFFLDFKCATLPGLLKCKYDFHPLTLSLVSVDVHNILIGIPSSPLWCELCEEEINKTNLFYMCNDCCTTVHVECLLGKHPYLKPGHKIRVNGVEIDIVSNKGYAPSCHTCHCLCQDKLFFINKKDGLCFCSTKCARSFTEIVCIHRIQKEIPGDLLLEAVKRYGHLNLFKRSRYGNHVSPAGDQRLINVSTPEGLEVDSQSMIFIQMI